MTNDETRKEAPNSNSHPITKKPENIFRFVNQVTGFVDLYRVQQHLSKIITDMHPKSKKPIPILSLPKLEPHRHLRENRRLPKHPCPMEPRMRTHSQRSPRRRTGRA